jgi:membrane protein YqaA with SNARE-associated domain
LNALHLFAPILPLKGVQAKFASFVLVAAKRGKKSTLSWLIHLGGPGLIALGLLDNSAIPLPGSMDVVTILLAAHRREPWIYYSIMATAGAILGGYVTYHMARKAGKEALEKRFPKKKVDKVCKTFEKWGFAAVAIPALLPPPFPIVPMLATAGALQYPTKKFLSALAAGRGVRYTILAFLGAHYGRHIVKFFGQYYQPTLIVLITLSVIASLYGLYEYRRRRSNRRGTTSKPAASPRLAS